MVMELKIEVFGEVELDRKLLRFTQAAEDMRPAFSTIHMDFIIVEQNQFQNQGVGPSGKWAPLAESTKRHKELAGLDPRILVAHGDLMNSLTNQEDEGHIYFTTADSMFIGSRVAHGVYHQSRAPRTRLPRRPPVDLRESTKRSWVKIIQAYLTDAFKEAKS